LFVWLHFSVLGYSLAANVGGVMMMMMQQHHHANDKLHYVMLLGILWAAQGRELASYLVHEA